MKITDVLGHIHNQAGLASSVELHLDRSGKQTYSAYIDHPRFTRTADSEKEAVARSIEAWLRDREQDHDRPVEALRVILAKLRGQERHSEDQLRKIEQEDRETDLRRGG